MKRDYFNMARRYNCQQQIVKGIIVSKSDVKKILESAQMPTNNNFFTVFRNCGVVNTVSKGSYQLIKNITVKGMEELFNRYSRYNFSHK